MAFNGLKKEPLEASYKPISNTAKDANFFWLKSFFKTMKSSFCPGFLFSLKDANDSCPHDKLTRFFFDV